MPPADAQRPRRRPRQRKHDAPKRSPAPRPSSQGAAYYVSQGRAVEHAAHQQHRAAASRPAEVKDTKGAADLGRANAFKRRPRYVRDVQAARVAGFKASPQYKHALGTFGLFSSLLHVANSPAAKLSQSDRDAIAATTFAGPAADIPRTRSELARTLLTGEAVMRGKHGATMVGGGVAGPPAAPSLFALHQLVRPSHAIMSGTHAALSGKSAGQSLHAAGQGFLHDDKAATGFDVAGDLGVKNKAARSAVGSALDGARAPVPSLPGGTSAPQKRAAEPPPETAAAAARDVSGHLGPREALTAETAAYKHAY